MFKRLEEYERVGVSPAGMVTALKYNHEYGTVAFIVHPQHQREWTIVGTQDCDVFRVCAESDWVPIYLGFRDRP